VLLGSTDIRVDSPDDIRCESDEVEYILKSLDYVFPGMEVRPENIIYRYSGVRPLPRSDAPFTASISRDHYIAELAGAPPVLCLVGGKWTTFRSFGEEAADRALSLLCMERILLTSDRPIGGGTGFPHDETGYETLNESLTKEYGISRDRAAHALDLYGTGARKVLEFSRAETEETLGNTSYSVAELRYLIRYEHARTLSDLLQRRTSLAITGKLSSRIIQRAMQLLAEELGLSQQQAREEEAGFRALLSRDHGLTDAILAERDPKPARSLACV
jgi:glycerol-3-phosphate dehydrogenase